MKGEASWSHIELICKDDTECLASFRSVMSMELPGERQLLVEAVKTQDYKLAATVVHKIKHKFSLVEMSTAYRFSVSYEKELSEGNIARQNLLDSYMDELFLFIGIDWP